MNNLIKYGLGAVVSTALVVGAYNIGKNQGDDNGFDRGWDRGYEIGGEATQQRILERFESISGAALMASSRSNGSSTLADVTIKLMEYSYACRELIKDEWGFTESLFKTESRRPAEEKAKK